MPPSNSIPEVPFALGQHEAEIARLREEMAQMREDVHAIKLMLAEAKGGWRVIMLVAGASGAVGAALAKFLPILTAGGK